MRKAEYLFSFVIILMVFVLFVIQTEKINELQENINNLEQEIKQMEKVEVEAVDYDYYFEQIENILKRIEEVD